MNTTGINLTLVIVAIVGSFLLASPILGSVAQPQTNCNNIQVQKGDLLIVDVQTQFGTPIFSDSLNLPFIVGASAYQREIIQIYYAVANIGGAENITPNSQSTPFAFTCYDFRGASGVVDASSIGNGLTFSVASFSPPSGDLVFASYGTYGLNSCPSPPFTAVSPFVLGSSSCGIAGSASADQYVTSYPGGSTTAPMNGPGAPIGGAVAVAIAFAPLPPITSTVTSVSTSIVTSVSTSVATIVSTSTVTSLSTSVETSTLPQATVTSTVTSLSTSVETSTLPQATVTSTSTSTVTSTSIATSTTTRTNSVTSTSLSTIIQTTTIKQTIMVAGNGSFNQAQLLGLVLVLGASAGIFAVNRKGQGATL